MENMFIVSAAKHKWFEHSISIVENIGCYKKIGEILTDCKIIKLFDGSGASSTNKTNPMQWKYNKFSSILRFKKFFSDKDEKNKKHDKINTFVSIGDSPYEYHAAGALKNINIMNNNNKNNKFFVHRTKFIHHPSIYQLLIQQYKLCQSCLYFEHYSTVNKTNVDQDYTEWINKQQKVKSFIH